MITAAWMTENKIAGNEFQANHIFKGLELFDPELTEAQQKARCFLYRKWRPKKDKKNEVTSDEAYALAIAGIDPEDVPERQIEMFEEEDDSYGYAEQKNFD